MARRPRRGGDARLSRRPSALPRRVAAVLIALLALGLAGCGGATEPRVDNQRDWPVVTPETEKLDREFVERAAEALPSELPAVRSFLVARNGRLVYERYYGDARATDRAPTYSITKSVISMLVGAAIEDGKIDGVDVPLKRFLPRELAAADERVAEMPLRTLLTMTAGFGAGGGDAYETSDDWATEILRRPLVNAPGQEFAYDNGSAHVVSVALSMAVGRAAARYAREQLFEPLGIEPGRWNADSRGFSYGAGGLSLTPRDLAKLGQLYLQDGRWDGEQLIDEEYVRESTTRQVDATTPGLGYGYLWWTIERLQSRWPPRSFAALGSGGQSLIVVPDHELVVVVTSDPGPTWFAGALVETFLFPAATWYEEK